MRGEPSSAGLAFDHFTVLFERLILCEFAIANLTTANANVFYELGVHHSVRSTAPTFGAASKVKLLRLRSERPTELAETEDRAGFGGR